MLKESLKQRALKLRQAGLHRKRQIVSDDRGLLQFCSNDYLSLTRDSRVKKAYQIGLERYPIGSGGAMLVCGYHPTHLALEKAFSDALQVDDALIFSSGYAANVSVLSLLAQTNAHVFIDKAIHASVYDGLSYSNVAYTRFLHNKIEDLRLKVSNISCESVIMTEGIFSMSGQIAPLAQMALLGKDLLVDEAHSFGVLGREGLGAVVAEGLTQKEVPLRVIPLGKAGGAAGAIVAGDGDWIDALLQIARPYIYSTAMSPAIAYGLIETLEILRFSDARRAKLQCLVDYFCEAIKGSPLRWSASRSPIQQLQLGCPHLAIAVAKQLKQHAITCLPMRQPTVSKQETGLRIILNYAHEPEQIDYLLKCLQAIDFEQSTV